MRTINIHQVYRNETSVRLISKGQLLIEFTGQRTEEFNAKRIKFKLHTWDIFVENLRDKAIESLQAEVKHLESRIRRIGKDC